MSINALNVEKSYCIEQEQTEEQRLKNYKTRVNKYIVTLNFNI